LWPRNADHRHTLYAVRITVASKQHITRRLRFECEQKLTEDCDGRKAIDRFVYSRSRVRKRTVQPGQIHREITLKRQKLLGFRVPEAKLGGMQRLPLAKVRKRSLRLCRELRCLGAEAGAIKRVSQQWMADMRHMHANLMGSARFKHTGNQARDTIDRRAVKVFDQLEMRDGKPALFATHHSHFFPVVTGPFEVCFDDAALTIRHAPDESAVLAHQIAFTAMVSELSGKTLMRGIVLGDDQKTTRFLVEPMHDARPAHAANSRKT
jgi:hypothetical protein